MRRAKLDPNDPRVFARVLDRIKKMPRDELIALLDWRPEGVVETWNIEDASDSGGRSRGRRASRPTSLSRRQPPKQRSLHKA